MGQREEVITGMWETGTGTGNTRFGKKKKRPDPVGMVYSHGNQAGRLGTVWKMKLKSETWARAETMIMAAGGSRQVEENTSRQITKRLGKKQRDEAEDIWTGPGVEGRGDRVGDIEHGPRD